MNTEQEIKIEKQNFYENIGYNIMRSGSVRDGEPSIIALISDRTDWIDEYCANLNLAAHLRLNLETEKLKSQRYFQTQCDIWKYYLKNEVIFLTGIEALKPLKGKKLHHNFFHSILSYFKEMMKDHQTVFFISSDNSLNDLVNFDEWTSGRFYKFAERKDYLKQSYSFREIQKYIDGRKVAALNYALNY